MCITGMYMTGIQLTCMYMTGMQLTGMCFIGMCFTEMYLTGVCFTGDRTGICLGTDMTISAYYFGIFKIIMHPF